jgi:hypothetical protein
LLLVGVMNLVYIIWAIRLTSVISGRCSGSNTRHFDTRRRS